MHVQERFPQFQIPDGDEAEAPEKIDNSKVSVATLNLTVRRMLVFYVVPAATSCNSLFFCITITSSQQGEDCQNLRVFTALGHFLLGKAFGK